MGSHSYRLVMGARNNLVGGVHDRRPAQSVSAA